MPFNWPDADRTRLRENLTIYSGVFGQAQAWIEHAGEALCGSLVPDRNDLLRLLLKLLRREGGGEGSAEDTLDSLLQQLVTEDGREALKEQLVRWKDAIQKRNDDGWAVFYDARPFVGEVGGTTLDVYVRVSIAVAGDNAELLRSWGPQE